MGRALRRRYGRSSRRRAFTVESGRQIHYNGKPFIGIDREGDTRPVDSDAVTRVIADCLNRTLGSGGVEKMHEQYMAYNGDLGEFRYSRKKK